ncbi:uncharacterized protein EDB91DRAFT_1086440 [Suillus paluster]|uniref:uncharacterized protein n=1 Tax=Suillus paluster TaxID=48578 RepID=UPI001B86F5BF|nr:uncharacterized protein EDB91DRAFT_1086440 [Suillus paluster]KAG1727362.1 hypothetical protein EDB91DRAFT_1086440 [Suillus paluster]
MVILTSGSSRFAPTLNSVWFPMVTLTSGILEICIDFEFCPEARIPHLLLSNKAQAHAINVQDRERPIEGWGTSDSVVVLRYIIDRNIVIMTDLVTLICSPLVPPSSATQWEILCARGSTSWSRDCGISERTSTTWLNFGRKEAGHVKAINSDAISTVAKQLLANKHPVLPFWLFEPTCSLEIASRADESAVLDAAPYGLPSRRTYK